MDQINSMTNQNVAMQGQQQNSDLEKAMMKERAEEFMSLDATQNRIRSILGKGQRFNVNIDEVRKFDPKLSEYIAKHPIEAIKFFEDQLIEARGEVKLKGNVERAAAEMPGIVEHRFNQLQEIEAILNYLNIELRRLRSSFFKKYLENYQRALSSRDVEKYVDGEADVVDYEKIINEFALLRNKWLGLLKGLDQKQWQITNVVKLRVAGMEDASL